MVDVPDSLRTVFSAVVDEEGSTYTVDVPVEEVENGVLVPGETYRVAIVNGGTASRERSADSEERRASDTARRSDRAPSSRPSAAPNGASVRSGPPVDEGEIREVAIESIGDQGDGIAKVDRGYVVIVPDVEPGDRPTVEIERVRPNVAFASVVEDPE